MFCTTSNPKYRRALEDARDEAYNSDEKFKEFVEYWKEKYPDKVEEIEQDGQSVEEYIETQLNKHSWDPIQDEFDKFIENDVCADYEDYLEYQYDVWRERQGGF